MLHTLGLLRIHLQYNSHAILQEWLLGSNTGFNFSKQMGMCMHVMCITVKIAMFTVPSFFFACVSTWSYDVAIRDVSAGCLAGPDDLHDLSSCEAVVPCNGVGNLYSW